MAKCGERGSEGVQLAVVRALLTFVTADHFVLHGESLMQVCLPLGGCTLLMSGCLAYAGRMDGCHADQRGTTK